MKLISTEFQFYKMKRVLEIDDGDSCRAICMYLLLLNCTLENDKDGKLYIYFTTIFLTSKKKMSCTVMNSGAAKLSSLKELRNMNR